MEKIINDFMTVIGMQQCEHCISHVQRHNNSVLDFTIMKSDVGSLTYKKSFNALEFHIIQ